MNVYVCSLVDCNGWRKMHVTHIHIYIHTHTHTYTYMLTYAHTHIHTHIYMHIHNDRPFWGLLARALSIFRTI